jgi:hypothetical protein
MRLNLPYSDELDIQHLSRLFDNMSECYKLFWFQSIVDAVIDGKEKVSYDELINQMVGDAWYMVSEYNLILARKTLSRIWFAMHIGLADLSPVRSAQRY